jgi:tryptophan-rich sensory protein
MASKIHEKIVEPLERAVAEMKGYAEGATGVPPGSTASHGAKKMAEQVLPDKAQEYLGMKEPLASTFTGRAFNFVERNILGRPLVFVAFPLILGLFVSSWVHKKIRTNRAVFDKIAVPRNVPPSWLYDPMWTVALTCMGYASWLIYNQGGFGEWIALSFYNMSLFLLVAWPFLFFGYHENQLLPAICASALALNTVITMGIFFSKSAAAGALMIPATLWIGYMAVLNWQVFGLNKGKLGTSGIKGKEETWPWNTPAASAVAGAAAEGREQKKTR